MTEPDRYFGRPFLRLIECYVLLAAGQLDSAAANHLATIGPQLNKLYGKAGAWDEIVAQQMHFDDSTSVELRGMWLQTMENAARAGVMADPQSWAEQVADGIVAPQANS